MANHSLTIDVCNKLAWERNLVFNSDQFGLTIVGYVQKWAILMQNAMADGETLGDIAEETSYVADPDGVINDQMFDYAIWTLILYWKHGEKLEVWYCERTILNTLPLHPKKG